MTADDRMRELEIWAAIQRAGVSCRLDLGSDVPVLYWYASQLRPGDTYLEIGTWMGGSAIIAALASPPGTIIWTIDSSIFHEAHWRHTGDEYLDILHRNFRSCGVADDISVSLEGSMNTAWAKDIDLLFIDGEHSHTAVSADIRKWTPFLSPDGIVLFHDYAIYATVKKAVDDFTREGWQELPGSENLRAFTRENTRRRHEDVKPNRSLWSYVK